MDLIVVAGLATLGAATVCAVAAWAGWAGMCALIRVASPARYRYTGRHRDALWW